MMVLSLTFLAFAVVHIAIWVWGWFAWQRGGRPATLGIVLFANALLWFDNFRIGIGRFVGEGELLATLAAAAFVWHWTVLPVFVIVAGMLARRAGLGWAQGRVVMGTFCVVAVGLFVLDVPSTVRLLSGAVELYPACIGDTLRYTVTVTLDQLCAPGDTVITGPNAFLVPVIMNVIMLGLGIALWFQRRWPWLAAGTGLMFIAAAPVYGVAGLPVANFGEVLFALSVMVTCLRFDQAGRSESIRH